MNRQRIVILLFALLLPLLGLEARLVYLQVLATDNVVGKIRMQKMSLEAVTALRGRILDRMGRVLAHDDRSFDLLLVLDEFEEDLQAADRLRRLLRIPQEEFDQTLDRIYRRIERHIKIRPKNEHVRIFRRERRAPYLFRRHVSFEDAFLIETAPELYPGVIVRESLRRLYPYGPVGGSIIGFVGTLTSNRKEFDRYVKEQFITPPALELIGPEGVQQILRRGAFQDEVRGRTGVEQYHDGWLRGDPGIIMMNRDLRTRESSSSEIQGSKPGRDLVLTIDIEIQRAVEAILQDARGQAGQPCRAMAVVMDTETGALLALGTNVKYDPNDFIAPVNQVTVPQLLQDNVNQPLIHRAAARHFQVGSIFKCITALAALEEGHATPKREIDCRGRFKEYTRFFKCWIHNRGGVHGPLTVRGALQRSCNIYFYQLGDEMGLIPIVDWAEKFGFGKRTGLDLPQEAEGQLPRLRNGLNWRHSATYSLAIGQRGLMATPVQVTAAMCAIANGGKIVYPHLAEHQKKPNKPIAVSPVNMRAIKRGLKAVVQEAGGTAHHSDLARFDVAGKTSTAQTTATGDTHAWFSGYFPTENPKYTVTVLVEYGGSGGKAAAPLAARIIKLIHEKILRQKH